MSAAFIKFTDTCGIHRCHTTRNRPQQNGIAEQANRTMADDISAMLFEAKLPLSLWGEALTTQIHVWNCLPTSSLKGMTPHEAWFKHKPDVSHLCVWGCLAYVFIQKDKCRSLQFHMETCVFVGYPSGYKGWKFYNPTTRKYIISERAEFDERTFPGLGKYTPTSPVDLTAPESLAPPPDTTPHLLLDLGGMMCWNYHLVILLTTRAASTSIQLLPFPKSPSLSSICYALSSTIHLEDVKCAVCDEEHLE